MTAQAAIIQPPRTGAQRTTWSVSFITNANYLTNWALVPTNALTGGSGQTNWNVAAITNAGTAAYSNATAFALAQSGTIVTQNNSFSLVLSNALKMDAAHSLSLSNATASRLAFVGADNTVGSAAGSGAVPVDADGSAATGPQVNALFSGFVQTNNNVNAITWFTNNGVAVGVNSSGVIIATNYAAAGVGMSWNTNGVILAYSATDNSFDVRSGTSGASSAKILVAKGGGFGGAGFNGAIKFSSADGSLPCGWDYASTGFIPGNDNELHLGTTTRRWKDVNTYAVLEPVVTKTTNYTATLTDSIILVNGTTLTMTLPTAVGNTSKTFTFEEIANSTGTITNSNGSQNINGSLSYSLSAQYKNVKVVSDGTQWWVIGNN